LPILHVFYKIAQVSRINHDYSIIFFHSRSEKQLNICSITLSGNIGNKCNIARVGQMAKKNHD